MEQTICLLLIFHTVVTSTHNLDLRDLEITKQDTHSNTKLHKHYAYLDPTQLQTVKSPQEQENAASKIISRYLSTDKFHVAVNPLMFNTFKDTFSLSSDGQILEIRASSGVAAVWGFNYFLKYYCNSQISWRMKNVQIPYPLPHVHETVVSRDSFRYYQNVCTASYSATWWDVDEWLAHVEWMALNGINLALAPVAQEAAWASIYRRLGLSEDDIDAHFTGPAFLAWLRMGNVRGWGGPLPPTWHAKQLQIQHAVTEYMFQLGMVPVLPAFSGHVPRALAKMFPKSTFYNVSTWNNFSDDYCCGLFVDPLDPLFARLGTMFLEQVTTDTGVSHIYATDPFNEVHVDEWSTELVKDTAKAIFGTLQQFDEKAVWLVQNWMFVHDPLFWSKSRVKSFLTAVPTGRMLVLDLQAEQWPQYNLYEMYFGQPFIWCMLHNFGGTLGMFGNTDTINKEIYEVRKRPGSTMIGMGLTPEGIFQNYVMYDLMLETAWRSDPIQDLEQWVSQYASRRYGCGGMGSAWKYLLKSVYSFDGLNRIRGKYAITRRPSMQIKPWAWYKSHDLFTAWRKFVFSNGECNSDSFLHDLVDVTRQALQYRAEQLYLRVVRDFSSDFIVFNSTVSQYLDVMNDMQAILSTHSAFTSASWFGKARDFGNTSEDAYLYELNARNQITLWGPNGEISDYACKQWAEMFQYYYIPRWRVFLNVALDANKNNERFSEQEARGLVRSTVEKDFASLDIQPCSGGNAKDLAMSLYQKWALVPGLEDLPLKIIRPNPLKSTTYPDTDAETDTIATSEPTVVMMYPTTSL